MASPDSPLLAVQDGGGEDAGHEGVQTHHRAAEAHLGGRFIERHEGGVELTQHLNGLSPALLDALGDGGHRGLGVGTGHLLHEGAHTVGPVNDRAHPSGPGAQAVDELLVLAGAGR